MGVVYAAYDEELDRRVAIKLLRVRRRRQPGPLAHAARGPGHGQALAPQRRPGLRRRRVSRRRCSSRWSSSQGTTLREWLARRGAARLASEVARDVHAGRRGLAAAHARRASSTATSSPTTCSSAPTVAPASSTSASRAPTAPRRSPRQRLARCVRVAAPAQPQLDHQPDHRRHADRHARVHVARAAPAAQPPTPAPINSASASRSTGRSTASSRSLGTNLTELSENVTEGRLRPPPADTRVPAWVLNGLRTGLATSPDDRHPSMDTLLAALTPDQVQVTRRRWQWPAALVGASLLAVVVTLVVTADGDPTRENLQDIERLTLEAHDAAQRMQWVYPTPADPRDTAYNRVVLLENLEGAAAPPAFAAANGLRSEFAAALVVLGDRYFDDLESRPYARDYYVQALVFVPPDPRASERSGVTLGQVTDLQAARRRGSVRRGGADRRRAPAHPRRPRPRARARQRPRVRPRRRPRQRARPGARRQRVSQVGPARARRPRPPERAAAGGRGRRAAGRRTDATADGPRPYPSTTRRRPPRAQASSPGRNQSRRPRPRRAVVCPRARARGAGHQGPRRLARAQ